jgi:hypothetical protein
VLEDLSSFQENQSTFKNDHSPKKSENGEIVVSVSQQNWKFSVKYLKYVEVKSTHFGNKSTLSP